MFVVWMGPIVGVLLPVILWLGAWALHMRGHYVLRFFAGFCLLANGAYLGFGTFDGVGDVGEMLELGTPMWLPWLFAGVCMPLGLWMWHGLGPHFGLGPRARPVDSTLAYALLIVMLVVLILVIVL